MPKKVGIYRIEIYEAWCKRCGICVEFCPEDVLAMDSDRRPQVIRPEKCTGCGWCEIRCPDFAISVRVDKDKESLLKVEEKRPAEKKEKIAKEASTAGSSVNDKGN